MKPYWLWKDEKKLREAQFKTIFSRIFQFLLYFTLQWKDYLRMAFKTGTRADFSESIYFYFLQFLILSAMFMSLVVLTKPGQPWWGYAITAWLAGASFTWALFNWVKWKYDFLVGKVYKGLPIRGLFERVSPYWFLIWPYGIFILTDRTREFRNFKEYFDTEELINS